MAAVFLAVALYLALCAVTPPAVAALCTGLAALIMAGILLLIGHRKTGQPPEATQPADPSTPFEVNRLAEDLGRLLGKECASLAQTFPKHTLGVSLLAGLAVGLSPRLRATLKNLLG
jgi:hypothetical protein